MQGRDDRSLAALLLTQRLVPLEAEPLRVGEYWSVLEALPELEMLLDRDIAGIVELTGVDSQQAARIRGLLDGATTFAFKLEQTEQAGMGVVASVDEGYPDSIRVLGRRAPPLIYAYGELSLLRVLHLGIVGSRNVAPAGAVVAEAAARSAVGHGHGVVSGAAKGVDQLAMSAALGAGGVTVGVVADSLLRAVRDAETRRLIGDGRLCLCSPYKPAAGFSVANAMGRNKLIHALSASTLVVASDHDKGGTWAGAVEALDRRIAPVLVWTGAGAGPGNAPLVGRGGVAISQIDDLFPLPITEPPVATDGRSQAQLSLNL